MRVIHYFRNPVFVAMLAVLTTAGIALADRGGRGGGGGGGSSRSFSGGGGGSSRSFSGGGGGGSSRSFSGGGFSRSSGGGSSSSFRSSSGGSSMRSFSGGNSGPSIRSFSGSGSGGSSIRSFSGGSSDRSSFSRSLGSGSIPSSRSLNLGGGNPSMRSFSGGNSDRSVRTFSGSSNQMPRSSRGSSSSLSQILGNTAGSDSSSMSRRFQSPDSSSSRTLSGMTGSNPGRLSGSASTSPGNPTTGAGDATLRSGGGRSRVDRSQLSQFLNGGNGNRGPQDGGNATFGNNNPALGNSSRLTGNAQADGRRLSAGADTSNRSPAFQRDRVTSNQVRDFLNLPGNENGRLANNDRSNIVNLSDLSGSNNGRRGSGSVADRFDNRNADAGREFRNLGNGPGSNSDRLRPNDGTNNRVDGPGGQAGNNDRPNLGNRDNDGNRWNGGRGRDGGDLRDGNRGDGRGSDGRRWDGKDFRGGDLARRDFDKWNNVWRGKNGDGRDHRDWSGKWRDGYRFDVARNIRSSWWNRRDFNRFPFCGGWWGRGNGWGFWDTCAFRYNRPFFWWGWTTCPTLTSWCNFGWSTPYYWDYGPGEYIYCNNGVVFVNGSWFQPAPVFYQQTLKAIDAVPAVTEELAPQVEWLPLGVFAVTPDGLNEPNLMAQLAVTKEGVIGGTVFDQKLGKSYNVQGTIDKNTQRAMWSFTNDQNVRVVMETSVNNLTQNESTGLVHYGPNDQRVVQIVRLEDPSNATKEPGATPPTPPQTPQVPPPSLPQ